MGDGFRRMTPRRCPVAIPLLCSALLLALRRRKTQPGTVTLEDRRFFWIPTLVGDGTDDVFFASYTAVGTRSG